VGWTGLRHSKATVFFSAKKRFLYPRGSNGNNLQELLCDVFLCLPFDALNESSNLLIGTGYVGEERVGDQPAALVSERRPTRPGQENCLDTKVWLSSRQSWLVGVGISRPPRILTLHFMTGSNTVLKTGTKYQTHRVHGPLPLQKVVPELRLFVAACLLCVIANSIDPSGQGSEVIGSKVPGPIITATYTDRLWCASSSCLLSAFLGEGG